MLDKKHIQQEINKLAKKYKNKKILVYGTAFLASKLVDDYDLSGLNIIGFADTKYYLEKTHFKEFQTYTPDEIELLKPDLILVTVLGVDNLKRFWKEYSPAILKIPFNTTIVTKLNKSISSTIKTKTNNNQPKQVQFSSTSDVMKHLCEIEKKLGLLNLKFLDIKIWQIIRWRVLINLSSKLGIVSNTPNISYTKLQKILYKLDKYKNFLFNSAYKSNKKVHSLIFSSPNLKNNNGFYKDMYMEKLDEKLKQEGLSYEFLYKNIQGKTKINFAEQSSILDPLEFLPEIQKLVSLDEIKLAFTPEFKEKIKKTQQQIKEIFDTNFELTGLVVNTTLSFLKEYNYYKSLLVKREPKQIFHTCSYGSLALIKAAKDLGIKVVELQHSFVTTSHVGYSYPYDKNPDYLPDEFYSFGGHWTENKALPFNEEKIINYGFKHLETQITNYKQIAKIPKQILVLSQWAIRKELMQVLLNNIEEIKDYKVIIKLHPKEERLKDSDPYILKLKNYPNVEISENKPLYDLLATSNYAIGVFSTSVYEAIEFGCKPIIVDISGYEHMEYIIKKCNIPILKKEENNILDVLEHYKDNALR